jgi:hypothetical protein
VRNSAIKLIQGVLAVFAAQAGVELGFQELAPGSAQRAAFACEKFAADQAGPSLDDDAGGNQDADPPHSGDEAPSRDETPQLDDPEEPPSGCIFDRKPLQLMV